jgi:hypothetical protein
LVVIAQRPEPFSAALCFAAGFLQSGLIDAMDIGEKENIV